MGPDPEREQGPRTKSQRSMDSEECINDETVNVGEVSAVVGSPDTSESGRLKLYVSEWQQLTSDPFIIDMMRATKIPI